MIHRQIVISVMNSTIQPAINVGL